MNDTWPAGDELMQGPLHDALKAKAYAACPELNKCDNVKFNPDGGFVCQDDGSVVCGGGSFTGFMRNDAGNLQPRWRVSVDLQADDPTVEQL